ncbi:MAG: hypothetical protein RLY78_201 [Pseudomonadota bacterium]
MTPRRTDDRPVHGGAPAAGPSGMSSGASPRRWARGRSHWRALPAPGRRLLQTGAVLLLAALALQWPIRQWAQEARALDARRLALPPPGPEPAAPVTAPATAAALALPPSPERPARVARLLDDARSQGLAVRAVREEAAPQPPGSGIDSRALSMELQGSYPAVRAHLARALAQDPALVLAALDLRRPAADSARLQADVRWVLLSAPAERP